MTLERTPGERPGDNEKSTLEVPSVPGENVISLSHFEVTVSYPRSVSPTSNDPVSNRRAFPVCPLVKGSHPYVQLLRCYFMYSYFIAADIYSLTVVACSYNLKLMQNFGRRQCPPLEGVLPSLKIILRQGVLAGRFLTVVFNVLVLAVLPVLQKNITSMFFLPEVRTFPTPQRKRVRRSLSSVVLFSATHDDFEYRVYRPFGSRDTFMILVAILITILVVILITIGMLVLYFAAVTTGAVKDVVRAMAFPPPHLPPSLQPGIYTCIYIYDTQGLLLYDVPCERSIDVCITPYLELWSTLAHCDTNERLRNASLASIISHLYVMLVERGEVIDIVPPTSTSPGTSF